MEGFLQSLKQKDKDKQRQVCSMKGKNAKKMTSTGWQTDQIVWWRGNPIDRQSADYHSFVCGSCEVSHALVFGAMLMSSPNSTNCKDCFLE